MAISASSSSEKLPGSSQIPRFLAYASRSSSRTSATGRGRPHSRLRVVTRSATVAISLSEIFAKGVRRTLSMSGTSRSTRRLAWKRRGKNDGNSQGSGPDDEGPAAGGAAVHGEAVGPAELQVDLRAEPLEAPNQRRVGPVGVEAQRRRACRRPLTPRDHLVGGEPERGRHAVICNVSPVHVSLAAWSMAAVR